MIRTISMISMAAMLSGCVIATAPLTVALRSNTHQQTASMDGQTHNTAGNDSVNADRKTALETAVSTATGNATTNGSQSQEAEPKKEQSKSTAETAGESTAEASKADNGAVVEGGEAK